MMGSSRALVLGVLAVLALGGCCHRVFLGSEGTAELVEWILE